MAGNLAAAGADEEPSKYAALGMDRYITGLSTQRSPLRDADVPYIQAKFYGATRFDSIWDGLNTELTADLTLKRRAGLNIWNSATILNLGTPYSFKFLTNGSEQIKVIAQTGFTGGQIVYDITTDELVQIFVKAANSGPTRYCTVGNTLYFGDGVNFNKYIQGAKTWQATTSYNPGDLLTIGGIVFEMKCALQNFTISSYLVDIPTPGATLGAVTELFAIFNAAVTIGFASLTRAGNIVTCLPLSGHTFPSWIPVGATFTIANAGISSFNGSFVATLSESGEIQWAQNGPAESTSLGTITYGGTPQMTPGQTAQVTGATTLPEINIGYRYDNFPQTPTQTEVGATVLAFRAPTLTTAGGGTETGVLIACQVTAPGTSGTAAPEWPETPGATVEDDGILWQCMGPAVMNPAPPAPLLAPTAAPLGLCRYWQPSTELYTYYAVLDPLGNIQIIVGTPGTALTGAIEPNWNTQLAGFTYDGGYQWINCGPPLPWVANTTYQYSQCILDTNGNLQYISELVNPGQSGATAPSWNGAVEPGGTTTDNNLTWVQAGPGTKLATASFQIAYSYHSVDGSVSTASPTLTIPNGILGAANGFQMLYGGVTIPDPQIDQIWWWRTPQGQSILIQLDTTPNPGVGSAVACSYIDCLPDTSLNATTAAPIAHQADPAPAALTAPAYHIGRLWGIIGNTVYYSNGANTGTGNGNTQFPLLNFDSASEQLVRLIPTTINGPALLVQGTTNLYVIAGSGTPSDPIQPMQVYMPGIGVRNYDALTIVGSTMYAYTNRRKFISLDPSAGYTEVGFFIGDQFLELTTGGFNEQIFDPNYVRVVWHERNSGDSAIYICDGGPTGGVGWFRFSPVSAPESGFVFSPFAAITGGISGVASIEVTPGQFEMLVGPGPDLTGPILKRDTTVFSDNGTAYPAWTVLGVIVLCTTGEIAELAWITLQSYAVGTKAQIGVLLDEIEPTTAVPWDMLSVTSYDPPDLASIGSQTMYSDRYVLMQNGACPKCTSVQFMIQWATEAEPNEVMTHNLYGARHGERATQ